MATPVRRTTRCKKPSLKSLESLLSLKIQNSGITHKLVSDDESDEDQENSKCDNIGTPIILHANEVVHGEDMFTFKNRKTKDGLTQKIAEACILKTPSNVREKTRNKIAKMLELSESESELSSEEYETSSSSDDSQNESSNSDDINQHGRGTTDKMIFKETKLQPIQSRSKNYNIKPDEYFEKTASKKIETSNNTLEKLETPRLPQYKLQKLLEVVNLTDSHSEALQKLDIVNETCFKKWLYFLKENFNILLYGLGSKRHVLAKFQSTYLKSQPVIVVNGYFPSLTIKNILDSILGLLEIEIYPGNLVEACDLIINEMLKIPNSSIYLLIHNIEGETLRNGKSQYILAKLAATRNIHVVASIDHINAPLIWDHSKLNKFNFIWWDSTSFAPYLEETSFKDSMMVQQSSTLAISALRNVFASLTVNSKSIYNIIMKYQLENSKNQYYQGLAFKDLYMLCRESFIVSSDLALRAQLTEFVDHKMLKIKRSVDGTEYLVIPLANSLLQKFLDEI